MTTNREKTAMKDFLIQILEALDMKPENGLATENSFSEMTTYQKLFYKQVHEKIGINAVYFLRDSNGVAKIPLIYFSAMEEYDSQKSAKLHQLTWNLGDAPLLFVVTPDELKVFDNYEMPRQKDGLLDPRAGLIESIKLASDLETQRHQLQEYNRKQFESGSFWRLSKARFSSKNRVDSTLINNLKVMRKILIERMEERTSEEQTDSANINIVSIVHGLLSRSILIKYLEERKDSSNQSVFPSDFFSRFFEKAERYTDVLVSKEATYRLYKCLEEKFNGDMLPLVDGELEIVCQEDLTLLRDFLVGNSELDSFQITLWPLYSFDIIPIQLISSIYELFFHLSNNGNDKGTYYTPLHLVDILMDEVYPWEGRYDPITVFDPACGSGIFLVEAYRRIVFRWMECNKRDHITNNELTMLLKQSIFGVDLNEEAIRVASFSLSLAMCDFLDPKSIWETLSFPVLCGENLFISDFFDEKGYFNQKKYDIVIGNPPWQSQLTELADNYLKKRKRTIGDKQIAQAFSIKCSEICAETGAICLVMPSKGFLFNRSTKSRNYRIEFFRYNTVIVIINFSIYRKFLFDHASGPAVGIIYSPVRNTEQGPIFYCTPKPQFTIEDSRRFSIEPTDICRLPQDIIHDDRIWKIAMWGGPRDLELIDKIQSCHQSLQSFLLNHSMKSAEGYNIGNEAKVCNDFMGMPNITIEYFEEFHINEENLPLVDFNRFQVSTDKNREVYKAPHLIIKQSHKNTHFLSAVLEYDAVFNHSFLGIHGDMAMLKYISLIIGSKVFSYYHLMTNRRWLVERDELEAGDIRQTPIPEPSKADLQRAVAIFDSISNGGDAAKRDEYVNTLYKLKEHEVSIIEDAVTYLYDYYAKKGASFTFEKPTQEQYFRYGEAIIEILENTFGKTVVHSISYYVSSAPMSVVVLLLGDTAISQDWIENEDILNRVLEQLNEMLTDKRQNVYIRRNVRIYGKDAIYIVKPNQKKYWNYSSACRDADEIFADMMKRWEARA